MARKGTNKAITNYWLEHYCTQHCTICGNSGFIDSTGITTAAGVQVGRVNYCICPNGQVLRGLKAPLDP
jgi:hypothetical protein